MMTTVLETLIDELRAVEHGQLIDRSRVIDHLLDLRLAADGGPLMTAIDALLADAPGRSTVETRWWRAALEDLASQAAAQPAPAG